MAAVARSKSIPRRKTEAVNTPSIPTTQADGGDVAACGIGDNRLPALAADIRVAHAGVLAARKSRTQRAIEAGRALIEAKALVQHGLWLSWLRQHCDLSERVAQLYMRAARHTAPKSEEDSDSPPAPSPRSWARDIDLVASSFVTHVPDDRLAEILPAWRTLGKLAASSDARKAARAIVARIEVLKRYDDIPLVRAYRAATPNERRLLKGMMRERAS